MKKIKIIDLLNMISKGEEVPEIIKYDNKIWNYKNGIMEYISKDSCLSDFYFDELNDEVEILEEKKKIPEKLGINDINTLDLFTKVNEIIDYLKSKGDE